jgi:hypothetical protein
MRADEGLGASRNTPAPNRTSVLTIPGQAGPRYGLLVSADGRIHARIPDGTTSMAAHEGTRIAILFAAAYPERMMGLVLHEPSVRGRRAPDYPWARSDAEWRSLNSAETAISRRTARGCGLP